MIECLKYDQLTKLVNFLSIRALTNVGASCFTRSSYNLKIFLVFNQKRTKQTKKSVFSSKLVISALKILWN